MSTTTLPSVPVIPGQPQVQDWLEQVRTKENTFQLSENGGGAADAGKVVIFDVAGDLSVISGIFGDLSTQALSVEDVTSGFHGDFLPDELTENREFTLPDASGTMALQEWVMSRAKFMEDSFTELTTGPFLHEHTGERGTWKSRGAVGSGSLVAVVSATGLSTMMPFTANTGFYASSQTPLDADYSMTGVLHYFTNINVGCGVGVRLDYTGASGIYAGYDNGLWVIRKALAATLSTLDSVAATLTAGQEYTCKLAAEGNRFTLYVDDAEILSVTDNDITGPGSPFAWGRNQAAATTGTHIRSVFAQDGSTVDTDFRYGLAVQGDSILGAVGHIYTPTVTQLLARWLKTSVSFPFQTDGKSIQTIAAQDATTMTLAYARMTKSEIKVAGLEGGINDFFAGRTASEALADTVTCVTNWLAMGYDYVFVVNCIKTAYLSGGAETHRQNYNAGLAAALASFGGRVIIVDASGNPNFSLQTNTRIFESDEIHLTAIGHQEMAYLIYLGIQAAVATATKRRVYVSAAQMIPRTTAGSAALAALETTTNDIMYQALGFDQTTEEGAGFWLTLPADWNAGTLTARFHWTAASGTGTVKWDLAGRCFADDDAIDQAVGTEQTAGADTLLAAGDMHLSPTTPALTLAGTPVVNRPCYFQVTRDVAGDTLDADALLLGLTLEFTATNARPAAQ